MGYGDHLMASAEARALSMRTGKKVVIIDRRGRPTWHDVWDGLPYIAKRHGPGTIPMMNCGGVRPYIAAKLADRWVWKKYRPRPAELVFTKDELAFAERARGRIVLCPLGKEIGHSNKVWRGWTELVSDLSPLGRPVTMAPPGTVSLPGTALICPPSFRHAAAVLEASATFVAQEGGLMHAGAAVGRRGVIIWSEFISPDITGYDMHVNLRQAGKACGMRVDCPTCRASLDAITPGMVADALRGLVS